MSDDIGFDLSSMAVCFDLHSTNVVQLNNQNPYFLWFWCHHPLITQLTVTFGLTCSKLNTVYCLQRYSKYKLCIFYKDGLVNWVDGGNNIIWFPSLAPIMKQKQFIISGRELTKLIIVFWLSLVREIMNISQSLSWEKRFFGGSHMFSLHH